MNRSSPRSLEFWVAALMLAAGCLVAFEALLLGLGTAYWTGGFQSPHVSGPGGALRYVGSAFLLDLALVTGSWTLAYPILRRFAGGPFRCAYVALMIGVAPSALLSVIEYRIHSILGRMLSLSLLDVGSAGSASTSAAAIGEFLPRAEAAVVAVGVIALLPLLFAARRIDVARAAARVEVPRWRAFFALSLAWLTLGASAFAYAAHRDDTLVFGLNRKTSGQLLVAALRVATDWDRDGYSAFSAPSDPSPFDPAVHPYALEIPGNGVDENGIGGDGPVEGFESAQPDGSVASSAPSPRTSPHVILVLLESFRADLLEASIDGRPVTPFLTAFSQTAQSSDQMFVHSPWTLASREHLFSGSLTFDPGGTTLVDDFLARGYQVAHFSGQDDSYGASDERLGFRRGAHFYDARSDIDRRTSRSTAAVSLQVSWKTLLSRVERFLESYDKGSPLFLYVNIVDTHFPYTHSEIDTIIASPMLSRSEIRTNQADRVFRTYANTAANVDRAFEQLMAMWQASFGDAPTAVVITADHGQSFYETGTLGHGQTLRSIETRVPLIVRGIGGVWPEPVGVSDLRRLILENLGRGDATDSPEFVEIAERRVFQYLGHLRAPKRIGLRSSRGTTVLDLEHDRSWQLDALEQRAHEPPLAEAAGQTAWTWERLQARLAKQRQAN